MRIVFRRAVGTVTGTVAGMVVGTLMMVMAAVMGVHAVVEPSPSSTYVLPKGVDLMTVHGYVGVCGYVSTTVLDPGF